MELLRQTVIDNPFVPRELNGYPFPSVPQAYFLTLPVEEALYGGAAGGGKSAALLAAALQYAPVPGYSAILFRRTFKDLALPGGLIPMSHEWLTGTGAEWDGQQHQWMMPGGSTLSFGYLEAENDHLRYKGSAFQFQGFDELTEIRPWHYDFVQTRLRRPPDMPVPLRVRAASNPGGLYGEEVYQRFILDGDADGRAFVPAWLEDNPGIDQAAYRKTLEKRDPVTRAQMLHGDWLIKPEGNLFKREWFTNLILDRPPPGLGRTVRAWDLAATEAAPGIDPDYTAGVKIAEDGAGGFVVLDVQEFRASPARRNAVIRATAQADGPAVEQFVEQEPGSAGINTVDQFRREVLAGFACYGVRSTGDKITRAKPFSAACENRLVRLVRGSWVGMFLDRLCSFGMPGAHDDVTDAAAASHRALTAGAEPWTADQLREAVEGHGVSLDDPPRPATFAERLLGRAREPATLDLTEL